MSVESIMIAEHWTLNTADHTCVCIYIWAPFLWARARNAPIACMLSTSFLFYFISMLLTWHKLIQLKYTRVFLWIFPCLSRFVSHYSYMKYEVCVNLLHAKCILFSKKGDYYMVYRLVMSYDGYNIGSLEYMLRASD